MVRYVLHNINYANKLTQQCLNYVIITDMTIEDVRKYESHLQSETNKRVTDGVNLEDANQPASWLAIK